MEVGLLQSLKLEHEFEQDEILIRATRIEKLWLQACSEPMVKIRGWMKSLSHFTEDKQWLPNHRLL